MKNASPLSRLALLLCLPLCLAGCNTFKSTRSPATTNVVQSSPSTELATLRAQVSETVRQLERTLGNLSRLGNAAVPAEVYAAFSRDQDAFAQAAERLLTDSGPVRNNGNAYFAEWAAHSTGIADADIRAISEQRRKTLESRYNAMLPPLVAARADLNTFVRDTADLKKALAFDQTPEGLAALTPLVNRTVDRGETAIASLKSLGAELDAIIALLPAAPRK